MSPNRESGLSLYSLGIVLENKARGSDNIKVSPIEELPMDNGLIIDQKRKYEVSAPDHKGIKRKDKVEGDSTIIAKWIPFGHSNRMTAPDVIRNETVILFRYSDTDEYYWTTIFREPKIRRLETVHYAYGNIPNGLTPFDKSTSYWTEYSTHDKYIHTHTSKNDGEPFTYDVRIDSGKGFYIVTDDVGNFLKIDSTNTRNKLENADKTFIDENKTRMHQHAPESFCIDSPEINLGYIGGTDDGCAGGTPDMECYGIEYIKLSKGATFARIGNKLCVYTHHDQNNIWQKSNDVIQHKSPHHKVKAAETASVETITRTVTTGTYTLLADEIVDVKAGADITLESGTVINLKDIVNIAVQLILNGVDVGARLGEHGGRLDGHDASVASAESRVSAAEADITAIKADIADIRSQL